MILSKEAAAEVLYEICRDRTLTSKEATEKFLLKANTIYNQEKFDKIQELIRNYKNTGNGLSDTIDKISTILNSFPWSNF